MIVRYYGYFGHTTGFGRAATDYALALQRHGATLGVDLEGKIIDKRIEDLPEKALPLAPVFLAVASANPIPDVAIVHVPPWMLPEAVAAARRDVGDMSLPVVAVTAWEASLPPDLAFTLRHLEVDQIWVPSHENARAFRNLAGEYDRCDPKVRVVPHTYDESVPTLISPAPRTDGMYRFYWYGAWTHRKNPAGVIQAFAHAFHDDDEVELFLHSPGARAEDVMEGLASTGLPQNAIRVVTSRTHLTDAQVRSIHANNDCFVSASRGEAWNLPAFEAMLAGRPVIATWGLGSDDYLAGSSAVLVESHIAIAHLDSRAVPAGGGRFAMTDTSPRGLSSRCTWREPSSFGLMVAMRQAYEAKRRTIRLGYNPAHRFGYASVAELMTRNLQETLR